MLLRPDQSRILPEYLLYQWLSPVVYEEQVLPLNKGSASPHLNIRSIKQFRIRLPDLEEQRRIVNYLHRLRHNSERAVQMHTASRADLDALLPSALDKAFRGEL